MVLKCLLRSRVFFWVSIQIQDVKTQNDLFMGWGFSVLTLSANLCYLLIYFSQVATWSSAAFSSALTDGTVCSSQGCVWLLSSLTTLCSQGPGPLTHGADLLMIKNFHSTSTWLWLLGVFVEPSKCCFVISHQSLIPSLSVSPWGALGLPTYCILFPLKWSKPAFVFVTWVKRTVSSGFAITP